MSFIVMKFGGSSIGDAERLKLVAKRIIKQKQAGHQCVVVVSAMGDTTDDLIDMSNQINQHPSAREMDALLATGEQVSAALLAMAIQSLGHAAVSYTGWQIGLCTEEEHGHARIIDIKPERLMKAVDAGYIVIVAGFQGTTIDGEITTLGRGGSDTTAVALAAAIEADLCEIYTDVEGIYSTDPRIIKQARKLQEISYDEMLELANLGAAVLHPRAVEYAKNYQVPLVVRSSFSDNSGTHVKGESIMEQGIVVRGIACDKNVARISILGVEDLPGILGRVFTALADEQINVDIIVQSGVQDGVADFAFTVSLSDEHRAMTVLREIRSEITYQEATSEKDLVKISIVGAGMVSNFGVAAKMFNVISQQGVSIKMVSTSEIRVSCVIDSVHQNEVLKQLHTAFGLDTDGQAIIGGPEVRR